MVIDKEDIVEFVYLMLEDEEFEELLERFDITASEAFLQLFSSGLVDEELLREMMGKRDEGNIS